MNFIEISETTNRRIKNEAAGASFSDLGIRLPGGLVRVPVDDEVLGRLDDFCRKLGRSGDYDAAINELINYFHRSAR